MIVSTSRCIALRRIVTPVARPWPGRFALRLLLVLLPMLVAGQLLAADTEAEARVEQMLDALGGRSAWAALTGTVNDSIQNRVEPPNELRAVITMDFRQPRYHIEMTAPGLHVIRVVDGDNSWRLNRAGVIEDVPQATLDADSRWYAAHVYRTLHRLAARDAALSVMLAEDGRLEVFEDGKRIAWYRLDSRGQPYAYGAHDDDIGSISGPWDFIHDGIHHPIWVSNADGSWRVRLTALELNPTIEQGLLARPTVKATANLPMSMESEVGK